jgi:hypothetical protein
METKMTLEELIKAIHALACTRHFDVDPAQVQVVVGPWTENRTGASVTPDSTIRELAETCEWSAQVRLGGGKWGHSVGPGRTQLEAAENLLRGYVEAHDAVDRRRSEVFERLPALRQYRDRKRHGADVTPCSSTDADFATWVEVFSDRMLAGLQRNAHKGPRANWLKDSPDALIGRVVDQMASLRVAVANGLPPEHVWSAAASMANMAGMVADSYAARHKSE